MTDARPTVLVIDDEPLLGQTIQLGLEDDFDVQLAATGQEALKLILSDETYGLILCDLSLPDISGADIYREMLDKKPELKSRFVVMTGGAFSPASQEFMRKFSGKVLNKPFTLNELEQLAHELVA